MLLLNKIYVPATAYPVVRLDVAPVARRYPYPPLAEQPTLYIYAPVLVHNPQCLHTTALPL